MTQGRRVNMVVGQTVNKDVHIIVNCFLSSFFGWLE